MTFPIKKRINAELFSDERAKLYIQNGSKKRKARGQMLAIRLTRGGNEKP